MHIYAISSLNNLDVVIKRAAWCTKYDKQASLFSHTTAAMAALLLDASKELS